MTLRTLFGVLDEKSLDEVDSTCSRYAWLPELRLMQIGRHRVLVNPTNGGWIEFGEKEYQQLNLVSPPPQRRLGEFLYRVGLCTRDGHEQGFVRTSDYTEQLYFFEFAVTTGCNLACVYCFADAGPTSIADKASTEIAEAFIDRIAQYRADTRTTIPFIIEFTGGEPLMNFKVIRHTIEYAERTYGDSLSVQFTIQSNLTLLTNEILEYAKQHKVGLGVSCDGFRKIHDKQRPFANGFGTHKIIESNITKLQCTYPENAGSPITVITEEGADKMPEIALYLYLHGYREIILRPMAKVGRGLTGAREAPAAQSYVEGLFKVLNWVITPLYYEAGELMQERYLSLTFQHIIQPYRAYMCERSPCGAARNICVVEPNGDVYPCNQSAGDKNFLLGNIRVSKFQDMLRSNVAEMLGQRKLDEIQECRTCPFRAWCGSPCPLAAYRKYGSIMAKSAECDIMRLRYQHALRGLVENEFDLSVVGKLAGLSVPLRWVEIE